jgi:hypothetical protein
MSTAVGLDRAVEYVEKLEKFRQAFQSADKGCQDFGETVEIETGRKFDKVYVKTEIRGSSTVSSRGLRLMSAGPMALLTR